MTDQNIEHPTQGRRRRHKSPPTASSALLLPMPRLADLDTDVGPSDSSRPPNENDEVMGITQVDLREAERFEEGG